MKISPEGYSLICTALSHSIVLLQQADVHGEYDTEFDCHSGKDLHEMAGQMRALLEELVGPNLELRRDAEERADDYHRDAVELITMIIGQKMKWPGRKERVLDAIRQAARDLGIDPSDGFISNELGLRIRENLPV